MICVNRFLVFGWILVVKMKRKEAVLKNGEGERQASRGGGIAENGCGNFVG